MTRQQKLDLALVGIVASITALVLAWPILPRIRGISDTAIVAIVVGGATLTVAWAQWRLARERFRLDLFKSRLEIFEATRDAITEGILQTSGEAAPRKATVDMRVISSRARFVFGPDIATYVDQVSEHLTALRALDAAIKSHGTDAGGATASAKHGELILWLVEELSGRCERRFAAYLDFSNWR